MSASAYRELVCLCSILLSASLSNGIAAAQPSESGNEVQLSDLLLLFHRITEPVLTPRGLQRDAIFDIPEEYLPEQFRRQHKRLSNVALSGNVRRIPVKTIPLKMDLFETTSTLKFYDLFIANNQDQGEVIDKFYHFFMEQETIADLLSAAVWSLLHFNPAMVAEALRETLVDRDDTQSLQVPDLIQMYSDQFLDEAFYSKARRELLWLNEDDPSERVTIPVVRTGTAELGGEDRLSYFREDPGLTLFHSYWHLTYPYSGEPRQVIKDRRGEIFTYFHRQILARYQAARLNFKMDPAPPLRFHEPVREGFLPKLIHLQSSSCYTQRPANAVVEGPFIPTLEKWMANVRKAIQDGYAVTANGTTVRLDDADRMDLVEDMLEGVPLLSPNYDFYGSVHNYLHGLTSNATNPWGLYDESKRVVYTLYTVKDPAFYNIHQKVDDLFEEYKVTLSPYGESDLLFPNITVSEVQVNGDHSNATNELHTFWLLTDLDVALGLEYTGPGSLFARFQRLAHEPFHYEIKVHNAANDTKIGFVRLFLLIQNDAKGESLDLNSARRWCIELDRFKASIGTGDSVISRKSADSSVSIDPNGVYTPFETLEEIRTSTHCRCGMPMSLLIPRGTEEGETYTLFAMITDYTQDGIDPSDEEICRNGWSLCGARETPYPDRRPMGFPFDRNFSSSVLALDDFLTPNMATQNISIKFRNEVLGPSELLPGGVSTSWTPYYKNKEEPVVFPGSTKAPAGETSFSEAPSTRNAAASQSRTFGLTFIFVPLFSVLFRRVNE